MRNKLKVIPKVKLNTILIFVCRSQSQSQMKTKIITSKTAITITTTLIIMEDQYCHLQIVSPTNITYVQSFAQQRWLVSNTLLDYPWSLEETNHKVCKVLEILFFIQLILVGLNVIFINLLSIFIPHYFICTILVLT